MEGLFTVCLVSCLCSLSTYDIVITTYNLLAKEIPTQKEEGVIPGANPSVGKVSLGAAPHKLTGVFPQRHTQQRYLPVRAGMAYTFHMWKRKVLSSLPFLFILDRLCQE